MLVSYNIVKEIDNAVDSQNAVSVPTQTSHEDGIEVVW